MNTGKILTVSGPVVDCGFETGQLPAKLTVARARKIQQFLSQPTHVAEKFTGIPGVYVPLDETLRGFQSILNGDMDAYPKAAFYNVGTIDEAVRKAEQLKKEASL